MAVASFEGVRLIPAHAGKTLVTSVVYRAAMAHPRSRGENFCARPGGEDVCGSSPREQGKPGQLLICRGCSRIIPA